MGKIRGDKDMKKTFCACVIGLVFLLTVSQVNASGYINTIRILENQKIIKGGSSVYSIDLTGTQLTIKSGMNALQTIAEELSNVNPLDAIFSIQFEGATPWYAPSSGATIPVISYAVSNILPTGLTSDDLDTLVNGSTLTERIEFIPIMPTNIAYDTGTSKFQHFFAIEPGKYLFIKTDNTSGITDFKMTYDLMMSKVESRKHLLYPMKLAESGITVTTTTGTSTFISGSILAVPDGARYAEFQVMSGGSVYWTTDGSTTPSRTGNGTGFNTNLTSTIYLTSRDEIKNFKLVCGASTTCLRYTIWNHDRFK